MKLKLNPQTPKTNKGFTLVELLLYMTLSATIILVVSVGLSALWQARIKNQAVSEVEQQGLFIMRQITQTVKNSSLIISPTQGTSDQTLTLETNSSSTNPTVYYLDSTNLKMTEAGGQALPLNGENIRVSNLEFLNLSRTGTPGIIRVSFTLTYSSTSPNYEYQYQANFYDSAAIRK